MECFVRGPDSRIPPAPDLVRARFNSQYSGEIMFLFRKIAMIAMLALLSACATSVKMQPSQDQPEVADVSKKVTLLVTVMLRNDNNPGYQPQAFVVMTERPDGKGGVESINFPMDAIGNVVTKEKTDAQLRLVLDPQPHVLRLIWATSGTFPIRGNFHVPLHMDVKITEPGVYYGGHIQAVVRPRVGEEFKAGPTVPLLDQGVVGASGGSFDVEVQDRYDTDIAAMREKFPALRQVQIKKALLPAWDRAKAQKWWAEH